MKAPLGLSSKEITASVKALSVLLADTYVLYLKTQKYHWHIKDAAFASLHEFLGSHYEALGEALDEIAERIRMLGDNAPATFAEFLKMTTLSEKGAATSAKAMLQALVKDHEGLIVQLRKGITVLENGEDHGTVDFLVGRLRAHEKMAWMLRSHLPK